MRAQRTRLALATVVVAAVTISMPALAQRGDDSGRASKNGRAEGSIGGVTVTVEYGRPNVKGRAIWGGLVPYGQTWRTGSDEATTIAFDKNVTVGGKPLPAGTYALFTIPGEKAWTVVFNKTAKQWGAFKYDSAQDALRVEVAPRPHALTESLTFEIAGDEVVLRWEKVAVSFRVAAAG